MKQTTSILVLCTLLLMAGCTTDVSMTQSKADAVSAPEEAISTHQVHYRATLHDGRGDSLTRATLDAEKGYIFTAGDLLFVRGKDENADKVYGVLTLNENDYGKSSGVTFEGELTVPDGFENEDGYADTPLEAILVGAESTFYTFNQDGNKIVNTIWPKDDEEFGNPPSKSIFCTSVAQAVECYSTLTAESTYGSQSFQFSQGSCFVNFSVTFDDDTPAGESINAYVWTKSDIDTRDTRAGKVTTVDDGGVVKANFVAAFPGGTVLDGAVVGLGERFAIHFGGSSPKTLEANKIYTVNKTFTRSEASISYAKTAVIVSNPDKPFTNELTNTGQGNETVTYTSDNEAVATVDAATGEVTIVGTTGSTGIGTATITATVEDGANYTYAEHTASYTVTVYDPVPLANTTAAQIGWVIGTDGNAYVTYSGVSAASTISAPIASVAIIGYVGDPGTADASSTTYRGLAIALGDAATSVKWSTALNSICTTNAIGNDFGAASASMTGITNTGRMASAACGDGHTHPAIEAVNEYIVPYFDPDNIHCSNWFLPSSGQWFKVFQACGVTTAQWNSVGWCPDSDGHTYYDNPDDNNCAANYTVMNNLMMTTGGSLGERYWTSTEYTSTLRAYYVSFNDASGVSISYNLKSLLCNVRPFIAF